MFPDFTKADLKKAILEVEKREKRKGA